MLCPYLSLLLVIPCLVVLDISIVATICRIGVLAWLLLLTVIASVVVCVLVCVTAANRRLNVILATVSVSIALAAVPITITRTSARVAVTSTIATVRKVLFVGMVINPYFLEKFLTKFLGLFNSLRSWPSNVQKHWLIALLV